MSEKQETYHWVRDTPGVGPWKPAFLYEGNEQRPAEAFVLGHSHECRQEILEIGPAIILPDDLPPCSHLNLEKKGSRYVCKNCKEPFNQVTI